ncbi:helix-turn-helix domain-containing protein [Demequina sp.]|uniref:helix-turn-helix domain-containing protein n=1 Tax=Demequina sp. TaxID=2050685 RepID=UPI003D0C35BF
MTTPVTELFARIEADVLTVDELADLLRFTPESIKKLIRSGELPALQPGRAYRILKTDAIAFVERSYSPAR